MVGVSGQQPKKPLERPPAPLLPLEQAWLVDLPAAPAAPAVFDDRSVYIALDEGGTLALSRETGKQMWANPASSPWALRFDGQHVLLLQQNALVALDRETGEQTWRAPLRSNPIAPAIIAGDLVVAVLENEDVVALRPATGTEVWSVKVAGLAAPVSLAADRAQVYLNVGPSRIVALALTSGATKWMTTLEGTLGAPAVAKDRVFVGSTANAFYALRTSDGKPEWNWGATMIGGDVIGASVDGDQVFFAGLDNLIHALNRGTGGQRWMKPVPTRPTGPPVAFGGAVFVFGVSPAIAAFNAKSGAALGTYSAPSVPGVPSAPVLKGPPLVDPVLRPFRVATVVITADGRAIGLRPTAMMFREAPPVPLKDLPGRPLSRERLPNGSRLP